MSANETETREALEQLLVADPFDTAARERYAALLLGAGETPAARTQYQLLHKQGAGVAAALGLVRCALAEGDAAGARAQYEQARTLADFRDDPELAERLGARPARPALRVVEAEPRDTSVLNLADRRPTRFVDVVGMEELKKSVRLRIIEPFLRPSLFARFAKRTGGGILLYGPPGCGKTLIARAIAGECSANFISVGISEVLNMWLGESERNLAALFEKARAGRPSVMFFDELDALAFARSKSSSDHTRHLVDEFLHQLDGLSGSNEHVLVLAATNMPWDVDPAMKRPGRFDRAIFVPPPDEAARGEMIRRRLQGVPCESIDAAAIAQRLAHFSGADIDGLVEGAKERVLGEILDGGPERALRQQDLLATVAEMHASTLDWLRTARNLVRFGGAEAGYKDVETYLKAHRLG